MGFNPQRANMTHSLGIFRNYVTFKQKLNVLLIEQKNFVFNSRDSVRNYLNFTLTAGCTLIY